MKKDKEWANNEIEEYLEIEGIYEARNALRFAQGVIDQLEEPEEYGTFEETAWRTIAENYHQDEVYWEDVKNHYVNSLREPKKPVIPAFVADFIKMCRSRGYAIFGMWSGVWTSEEREEHKQALRWIKESNMNAETTARAWLFGYEVEEKEKFYRVMLPTNKTVKSYIVMYRSIGEATVLAERTQAEVNDAETWNEESYWLTEQEIKEYDERFWAFAVPVEEDSQ